MIRKNILKIVFQMLVFVGIVGNVVYATENNYEMTEETRQIVNEAILDFPDEEKFIVGIAEMYQKPLYFSNEEYNVLVQEGVREFVAFKEDLCTSAVSPYVLAPILDYQMYLQAMETLSAGVAALNSMGLSHTAEALGYSRVYNYDLIGTDYEMEPLVYDNDEWANALYWDSGLEFRCFDRFEQEALVNGKTSGAFSGTYVYEIPDDLLTADRTLLDMAMQLHQVNYMVTYAARGEDIDMSGYYIHVYIWDVYDFVNEPDLGETYGQLVVNLANNNCATYQEAGYIHEFEIHAIVDF